MNTKRTTYVQALREVLEYDNADAEAIEDGLELFKSSNTSLEAFILEMSNAELWNTGGGCTVSVLRLDTGELFITTDEMGGIFKDEDAFLAHEGEPLKYEWYYTN